MRKINPNLRQIFKSYKDPEKNGVVLEGSSRSGKTWSVVDFIPYYCSKNNGKTINIIRETYHSFKTTLYLDFNKRFPDFGLISPFADVQERSTFRLFGNQINLIGADKPSKFMGAGCDVLWLNEAIHVDQKIFDQAEMRCSEFFIMDYNPEVTEHWIYASVIPRNNVDFLRTTFLDNPSIPENQKNKILSYDPSNPENVEQGTANRYMWDVFGLGKRARKEGAIYKNWRSGQWPEDKELTIIHGLDWGFTDPFSLIEVGIDEPTKQIYVRQKVYQTELIKWRKAVSDNVRVGQVIVCDSAVPGNIHELRMDNHEAYGAWKGKGSILKGITWLQGYSIVVCNSPDIEHELNNYEWAVKENTPIDKYNHACDSIRYAVSWYKMNIVRE